MTTTAPVSEAFTITEEILVRATLEKTFASLIAQMGRLNETPDGKPLPMVLEARPGGRWYRELGGDNGHLWGFVQSIKRPVLLEIWGPLLNGGVCVLHDEDVPTATGQRYTLGIILDDKLIAAPTIESKVTDRARISGGFTQAEVDAIDGVRVKTRDGWWLLRASNTQDVLVARCEAADAAGLARLRERLARELAASGVALPRDADAAGH